MSSTLLLQDPPAGSYVDQVVSCPSCYGLEIAQKNPEDSTVCVPYGWGGEYWHWTKPMSDLRSSDARGCQICGVLCDALADLKRCDDCEGISPTDTIDFMVPMGAEGYFHVTLSWQFRDSNGDLRNSTQTFQIGTSSACGSLPFERLREAGRIPEWPHGAAAVSKVSSWLADCIHNHSSGRCRLNPSGLPVEMPRRLIRIGDVENEPILIETEAKPIPYVALSHCWGDGKVLKTTSASQSQWEKSIPYRQLSDTFREAMLFASKLGFHHIWIDSLCIVQDDSDDWSSEASRMGIIYREASLVISVALATEMVEGRHSGWSQGFFKPRRPTFIFRNRHRKYESEPERFIFHSPVTHMNLDKNPPDEDRWPLFRRGWTLQERLLATRILHFTPHELVWECKTEPHCECRFLDDHNQRSFKTTHDIMLQSTPTADSLMKSWCSLVRMYMDRNLTRDSDRLPAISALANQYSGAELGMYLAGCWRNYLLEMISWYKNIDAGGPSGHRRPSSYSAPSWSWASLVGSIDWSLSGFIQPTDLPKFVAEIKEAECELSSDDRFGSVKSGHLIISSPYLVSKIQIKAGEEPTLDHEVSLWCILDVDPIDGQYEVEDGQEVICLFLNELEGNLVPAILIKPCDSIPDSYVRVGRILVWEDDVDQLPTLSMGAFKIT